MRPRLVVPTVLTLAAAVAGLAPAAAGAADRSLIATFGGPGSALGLPTEVAVDPTSGALYAVDASGHRLLKLASDGKVLQTMPLGNAPGSVAVRPTDGQVAVTDLNPGPPVVREVHFFTAAGVDKGVILANGGSLAYDAAGNLYQSSASGPTSTVTVLDAGTGKTRTINVNGSGGAIAVGPGDNLYISDSQNTRMIIHDTAGPLRTTFGGKGTGNGQFGAVFGVAVGPDGHVFTADPFTKLVQEFDAGGGFVARVAGPDGLALPDGVASDCRGTVFVVDAGKSTILRYGPTEAARAGNRLAGPGAEAAPATCAANGGTGLPGWKTSGAMGAVEYGAGGGFPGIASGDGLGGGVAFFSGGDSATATATQTVDLSADAGAIDAGRRSATLSGLLGGIGAEADAATLTAVFAGADGTELGRATIGPVTPDDRAGQAVLLPRATTVRVPAGARTAKVTLAMTRASGPTDDAMADRLGLVLAAVDPPAPAATTAPSGAAGTGATGTLDPCRAAGAPCATAPRIAALTVSPATFKAAPGARSARGGTVVRFRLSRPGRVTLTAQRRIRGRHFAAVAGSLSVAAAAGTDRVRFTGRLNGRALRPGSYRLTVTVRPPARGGGPAAVAHRAVRITA